MPWTKSLGIITAEVGNEDLSANHQFDQFDGGTVTALRCDFTIASDNAEDQIIGFRVSDALTAAEETQLKQLLAKERDYALGLAGYTES